MSQSKSEILPLFKELFTGTYSVSASNQLIEDCIRIAKHYLYAKRTNLCKFILNDDVQVIDLAIDAVAPLFCKNPDDEFLPILKEFQSWQPPIQTEEDALFFLNRIVASRVDQHISHLLKEHDPFFAKIFDSVNYLIRKGGYKKVSCFGRKYIVQPDCAEINGKTIDQESFENLPFALFQNTKTLLSDIFKYLENETESSPAIPLNALVVRLRSLKANDFLMSETADHASSNIDVDEIVKIGFNCALDKLKVSYYEKGKLTDCEHVTFKKALDDMAGDLKDGGINHGLYDYLEPHMHRLSKQEYQDKYHNILEYLLKVMKNTIREQLTEDNR